jgi:hypothetical protein
MLGASRVQRGAGSTDARPHRGDDSKGAMEHVVQARGELEPARGDGWGGGVWRWRGRGLEGGRRDALAWAS